MKTSIGRMFGADQTALARTARIAAVVGAIGSVGLTLYAGRSNGLAFLMVLMAIWVFAPFMACALAGRLSVRWARGPRAALDVVIVLVAVASLVIYVHDLLRPPLSHRAFVYVAVPAVSWVLLSIVVVIGALDARRRSREGADL